RHCVAAVLYPVAGSRSRIIRLTVAIEEDDDPCATGWADDVETRHWFPHGTLSCRFDFVPGTTFALDNHYTVLTARNQSAAPPNLAVQRLWGLHVRGNVLVLRHSSRRPMRVTNISPLERPLVDLMISR
ncbi:hypothetical protein C8Q76DRAFT_587468, partial [Earliella scabrosa]